MTLKSLALSALLAGSPFLAACAGPPAHAAEDPSLPPLASGMELGELTHRLRPYDYTITLAGLKAERWQPTGDLLYWHRYRMIWQAPQGPQADSTPWRRIPREQYDEETPLEGLAVAARQDGRSLDGPVAPEMAFVGNDRYGHWSRSPGGDSFWEWYGKYALMRDLMGTSHRPLVIHRTEYNTYRRSPLSYRSASPAAPSYRAAPARPRGFAGKVSGAMDDPVVSRSRAGSGWRSSRSTSSSAPSGSYGSTYQPPRASSGSRSSGGSYYSPPRSYGGSRSYSPPSTRSSGWGGGSRRSGRRP
jgi:hypothetical protein